MYKRVPRRKAAGKGFTFEFSGFGLTLVVLSLLIICFLCFTLGVMGGFYMSGRQFKAQLPTEAEIAGMLAKKEALSPKHRQAHPSPAKPESAGIESTRQIESTPVVSDRPKSPQSIANKEKEPAPPAKDKQYVVQAASFQNLAKAHKVLRKIKSGGFEGNITQVQLAKRGTWFRICLGPYPTESEAKDISEQLKRKFKFKPIVAASAD